MSPRLRSRRGFTLIEMLVVFVVIGILASISILKYIDLRRTAQTARVSGDFNTIKIAVYTYYSDANAWPAEVGPGVVPPELVPILSPGFTFVKDVYTLDYDYFPVSGSGPGGYIVGDQRPTTDPVLMTKLEQILGRSMPFLSAGGAADLHHRRGRTGRRSVGTLVPCKRGPPDVRRAPFASVRARTVACAAWARRRSAASWPPRSPERVRASCSRPAPW